MGARSYISTKFIYCMLILHRLCHNDSGNWLALMPMILKIKNFEDKAAEGSGHDEAQAAVSEIGDALYPNRR